MESDDFIGLEPSPASENNDKGHGVQGDDPNVLDMDIEEGITPQPSILYERAELFGHTTAEQVKARSNKDMDSGSDTKIDGATTNNIVNDESSITGGKRAQNAHVEKQPYVRVIFNSLTRESKRKLMELMKQWSQWQAENQLSSSATGDASLEDGEETYFPVVYVGSKKLNTVTFWIDNQARQEVDKKKESFEAEVPFYDRVYTLGSNTVDGSSGGIEISEASRCFNCGSYSHSLKECPKPRDHVAIINARKMHSSSRRNPTDRAQARYHQKIPGKFDDLRAGVLGPETRECLGIGEYDPPPWFHRMREIGYPPGYLDDDDENQPSGITIFDDEETKEKSEEGELREEGELPERSEPEPPQKKMTVAFPGINAPIPDNTDPKLWATPPTGSGSNSSRSRVVHRSNHSYHHEQRWSSDVRDDSMLNLDHKLPSSYQGYSPRYSPYDHNSRRRSPKSSERGWRSPSSH